MASTKRSLVRGREYTRTCDAFRGVNLSGEGGAIGEDEFVYLENMYRDYGSEVAGAETFPGYRALYRFDAPIHGIYGFPLGGEEGVVVYAGNALYRFAFSERDNLSALSPILSGLSGEGGTAFCFRGDFYLLDGGHFYRVTPEGAVSCVEDAPYIPVVSLNGDAYEERNLLTDKAVERTVIGDASEYATQNDGLRFAVNADGVTARVVSYEGDDDCLVIPGVVRLGGVEYPVTVIGENACANRGFRSLSLPEGLLTLEKSAFRACRALETLVLPSTLSEIFAVAFVDCTALSYIYIGEALKTVGGGAFGGCTAVKTVSYALSEDDLSGISDEVAADYTPSSFEELCAGAAMCYHAEPPRLPVGGLYRIPLSEAMKSIISVSLDGSEILSGGSPLFSPYAEELFPYATAMVALRNTPISFLSFSTRETSFSVSGTADEEGDIYLGKVTATEATYRLSGTPSGGNGRYHLRAEYVKASGETATAYDTGSGSILSDVKEGSDIALYFGTKSGVYFAGNAFTPSLVGATDRISFRLETAVADGRRVVTAALLSVTDESLLHTATLDVYGRLPEKGSTFESETGVSPNASAILACRLSAVYDGRVFLSGNPDAPSVTFYPARNREGAIDLSYFGIRNYFIDGKSTAGNASLLATASGLFILKGEPDGVGSVYCRVGADTGDDRVPRVYPLAASCDGELPTDAASVFCGRVVFLSRRGLFAVGRESLESDRRLYEVSGTVERRLASWDGKRTAMTVFDGYLLLSDGEGNCLLADSRQLSGDGYAFYALSGIGSYVGDKDAYEYAFSLPEGAEKYHLSETPGALCTGEVKQDGAFYYTEEKGVPVLLSFRGEKSGGVFSPARVFCTVSDTVLFGTEDGTLSLFNTDLRGEDGLFPSTAYSFAGHRYRSGCALRRDNAGVPQLLKNTVRHSAVLKTKNFRGGRLNVLLRVDTEPFRLLDVLRGGEADFGETDFDAFRFCDDTASVHSFRDASRRYAEKQYGFYTEDYKARFGLCEVSYRFKIGGRIR